MKHCILWVFLSVSECLWKKYTGDSGGIRTHDLLLTSVDVLTSQPPSLPDDDWPARILGYWEAVGIGKEDMKRKQGEIWAEGHLYEEKKAFPGTERNIDVTQMGLESFVPRCKGLFMLWFEAINLQKFTLHWNQNVEQIACQKLWFEAIDLQKLSCPNHSQQLDDVRICCTFILMWSLNQTLGRFWVGGWSKSKDSFLHYL